MLDIGDEAPDFTALLDSGETFTLSEQRGKRSVALFFFPRAGSPGCTREAAAFQRAHDDFMERNAVVIGVGPNDAEAVRRFAERDGLPFRLAADPDEAEVALKPFLLLAERVALGLGPLELRRQPVDR